MLVGWNLDFQRDHPGYSELPNRDAISQIALPSCSVDRLSSSETCHSSSAVHAIARAREVKMRSEQKSSFIQELWRGASCFCRRLGRSYIHGHVSTGSKAAPGKRCTRTRTRRSYVDRHCLAKSFPPLSRLFPPLLMTQSGECFFSQCTPMCNTVPNKNLEV